MGIGSDTLLLFPISFKRKVQNHDNKYIERFYLPSPNAQILHPQKPKGLNYVEKGYGEYGSCTDYNPITSKIDFTTQDKVQTLNDIIHTHVRNVLHLSKLKSKTMNYIHYY